MISYVISYMISVRLQPPILPRHSALMQTMVGMSVMLTWTEKWMPTRSVTMLTKTPSQRVTYSTFDRWRQIWLTLNKTRVMTQGNLFLPLLLIRRVKRVLASWGSDTQHCNQYTLGN